MLFLPVIGFLIQSLAGKWIVKSFGKRVAGALAVLPIAGAFVIGAVLTLKLAELAPEQRVGISTLADWINIASIKIPFEFRVDTLSMTMVLIITGIGALIHLYATGYMAEEKDYTRFFTYLNLFIAAMLILVLGNNLVMLFIGWEGVGLCSYLLIGFWYKDLANAKAANKAFIVNRIGDWGLTLGIFLLMVVIAANAQKFGITDGRYLSYDAFLPRLGEVLKGMPGVTTTIALLLFVGACGKSAQFPLYLWLPDAMAGPTPVSALIHAATMVTSGVVLLNRMNVVYQLSPVASAIVAAIGAFTALFAALIAFGQTDIKKVLAYSTVSQLGFMFVACGAGAYWAGMFHVTTHAFFKALLFLGSGAVIHAMSHNQDMRNYGKLYKYLPITCWTMFIGFLAIAGIPPLAGFWSKEAIIGSALANNHAAIEAYQVGQWAGWTALFVALLTAFYMTRMTWLTFFGKEERWRAIPAHAHAHGDEAHAVADESNPVATAEAHPVVASTAAPVTLAAGEGYKFEGDGSQAIDESTAVHEEVEPSEDHGHHSDEHGFFYTHDEIHAMEHAEHEHDHHELDQNHTPHEVPFSMWIPLAVLAVLSLGGGWYLSQNDRLLNWLYPGGELQYLGEVSEHPHGINLMALSLAAAIGGIVLGLFVYFRGLPKKEGWDESKWNPFRRWAGNQFGYDSAMVNASVQGGADIATLSWKGMDAGLVDGAVNGSGWLARGGGWLLHFLQTGYVRFYALGMLVGGVAILGWFTYSLFLGAHK